MVFSFWLLHFGIGNEIEFKQRDMGSTGESGKRDGDGDEDGHGAERERMRPSEGSGFSLLESDGTDLQSTQK